MKVRSVAVASICCLNSLAFAKEQLRGSSSVYYGKIHVVDAGSRQSGSLRNLASIEVITKDGEVPVPEPIEGITRQESGVNERGLFESHPDVVKPESGESTVTGTVFNDANMNGVQDDGEAGIEGVMVSNGRDVVMTDSDGVYILPPPTEEEETAGFTVFVTKPAGYQVPVNEDMVPQFHYNHKPQGTPNGVHGRPFRFGGLPPTGPVPLEINFPLVETENIQEFKIVISGDPQTYSNNEIGYMRDSIMKDMATMDDVQAIIFNGDVMVSVVLVAFQCTRFLL